MYYLVTYDIIDDKNRKKLSDILEKYGVRVNYSVFECELNKSKLKRLLEYIKNQKLYDNRYDSIRFYHICKNCVEKSFELSNRAEVFENMEFFI